MIERVVARETPAEQRCPFCHDALAGSDQLPADDLVECDGCRTKHHRACIEELGRCTIRGCERSLHVAPRPEPAEAFRSAAQREVQRRVRERARSFVQAHARPVGTAGGRAEVEAGQEAAHAAEEAGDLNAAAAAWHEVARRLMLARPDELRGLELRGDGQTLRLTDATPQGAASASEWAVELAEHLGRREASARARRVGLVVAVVFAALLVVVAVVAGAQVALTSAWALALALALGGLLALGVVVLLRALR